MLIWSVFMVLVQYNAPLECTLQYSLKLFNALNYHEVLSAGCRQIKV
jgi:hypothetical protein